MLTPIGEPLPQGLQDRRYHILETLQGLPLEQQLDLACRTLLAALLLRRPSPSAPKAERDAFKTLCTEVQAWLKVRPRSYGGRSQHQRQRSPKVRLGPRWAMRDSDTGARRGRCVTMARTVVLRALSAVWLLTAVVATVAAHINTREG